ncbi:MAG: DUF2752 domain-containing protein [Bacteroidales bacterium]|nr:DUF2752 domain-containing protein [Bacteroidales bacterium]
MRVKQILRFTCQHLELLIWLAAVVILYSSSPENHHYTLCPLDNLGFSYCPGCGLGRSVTLALHGHIAQSLQMHPFGLIAIIVIFHRIAILSYSSIKFNHPKTQKL